MYKSTGAVLGAFVLILTGCSLQSRIDGPRLSKELEQTFDALRQAKVAKDGRIFGIVEAIYLNSDKTDSFCGEEFYLILYPKSKALSAKPHFLLNDNVPLEARVVEGAKRFGIGLDTQSSWSRRYLLRFAPVSSKRLLLRVEFEGGVGATLAFEKRMEAKRAH